VLFQLFLSIPITCAVVYHSGDVGAYLDSCHAIVRIALKALCALACAFLPALLTSFVLGVGFSYIVATTLAFALFLVLCAWTPPPPSPQPGGWLAIEMP